MTTYKEFLQQHDRLTGNVVEALKERDTARERCTHAEAQYEAALAEDRPTIEPELKSARSALSGSEERLDVANQELVQYEWDHRELDDARREGIAPKPSAAERLEGAIGTARNVSAVVGIATQLHVAVPPDPSPTVEVKAAPQGQLSEGPEKENIDDLLEPLAKEPDELREDGERRRKEMDDANKTYDDALENAPSRSGTDIAPPREPFAPESAHTSETYKGTAEFAQQPAWPDPEKRVEAVPVASRDASPVMPDPEPSAAAIAAAPPPANDNQQRAANDNDPRRR